MVFKVIFPIVIECYTFVDLCFVLSEKSCSDFKMIHGDIVFLCRHKLCGNFVVELL